MITFDDVKNGYEHKAVVFCNEPFCSGGRQGRKGRIVCRIGHKGWNSCWFYFGGMEAEKYTNPVEFVNDVGLDNALKLVTSALNDCIYEIDKDEYAFYESVLKEYENIDRFDYGEE